MKRILGGIAVAAVLLTAGVAGACDCGWGHGTHHAGQYGGASPAAMKKFQKETASLRETLAEKQIDLAAEYDKAEPDAGRIAAIRKDIVDIEAKLQAAGEKHGVRQWGRGHGRWMAEGWGGCW
jgi:zinc resistance-associated protein